MHYLFPNSLLILTATWMQVIRLLPVSESETSETLAIYFVRDETQSESFTTAQKEFIAAANRINEQDLPVIRGLQRGMRSTVAGEGQYIRIWDENPAAFHRRMLQAMDYRQNA